MLLDSGATHILRAPVSQEQWQRAGETVAQTATGECILRQTESGVLLTNDSDAAPIIPLGELVAQGGVIDWRPGQCRLHQHPPEPGPVERLQAYLMDVARSGKVKTFLAGPPCRSVSVLRLRDDGGPRQVRDREGPERWGKRDLKPHERALVDTDSQLLLRTLVLAELCESANPGETEFMVETPEDPATYREGENIPTFTVWPEVVQVLEKDLKLRRISVDQGALDHARKKPTCLWSSIPEVVQLDGLRDSRSSTTWPTHLDQALLESKSLAAWAGGLKQAVVDSWQRARAGDQPRVKTVRGDTNWAWYQHILNGHVPHRRDCRECLRGAGRDRPRLRQQFPSPFTMAVDVAGPFAPGCDQDMGQPRYFLVATVTVPVRHDISAADLGLEAR